MISPKIVMMAVEIRRPARPLVRSPIRIDSPELTETFPNKIVQRRRLPLLLSGRIFAARCASKASDSSPNGPLVSNSKFLTSKPSNSRLSPENNPDIIARHMIRAIWYHSTSPGGGGTQYGTPSSDVSVSSP